MNRILGGGLVLAGIGLFGYVAGVTSRYPGRAFAVTLLMIGITLIAIGRAEASKGDGEEADRQDGRAPG